MSLTYVIVFFLDILKLKKFSKSLALGRPPAMHLSYIDCEFPIDEEATLNDKGEIHNGCTYVIVHASRTRL